MDEIIKIDATQVWCPNFTTPVMSLIKKKIIKGHSGVVITKEKRSVKRMEHLCASFDWLIKEKREVNGCFIFLVEVP